MCTVLLPPGVNQMCIVLLPRGVKQMCPVIVTPGVNQMCAALLPPGVKQMCNVLLPPGVNQIWIVLLPPGVNQMCKLMLPPGVNQMCAVLLPPGVNKMCAVLLPPGVNPIAVKYIVISYAELLTIFRIIFITRRTVYQWVTTNWNFKGDRLAVQLKLPINVQTIRPNSRFPWRLKNSRKFRMSLTPNSLSFSYKLIFFFPFRCYTTTQKRRQIIQITSVVIFYWMLDIKCIQKWLQRD
jgi:hypothetical protein